MGVYGKLQALLEWLRIYRFRLLSWGRLNLASTSLLAGELARSALLAVVATACVALVDSVAMGHFLRWADDHEWYGRIKLFAEFAESGAAGNFVGVLFGAIGGLVALVFTVSLVVQNLSTTRYGESVSALLFREPLTVFVRSYLIIGLLFILAAFFAHGSQLYVPYWGTYLSLGFAATSVLLLPVYLWQSLASGQIRGLSHALERDATQAIQLVASGRRRLGRSVEAHLRGRVESSIGNLELLAQRLQRDLQDERGLQEVVAALVRILRLHIRRKHRIPAESEWFPIYEVRVGTSNRHSYLTLKQIFDQLALGPPRRPERAEGWLEDRLLSAIGRIRSEAVSAKEESTFSNATLAHLGIAEDCVKWLRYDLINSYLIKDLLSLGESDDALSLNATAVVGTLTTVIEHLGLCPESRGARRRCALYLRWPSCAQRPP